MDAEAVAALWASEERASTTVRAIMAAVFDGAAPDPTAPTTTDAERAEIFFNRPEAYELMLRLCSGVDDFAPTKYQRALGEQLRNDRGELCELAPPPGTPHVPRLVVRALLPSVRVSPTLSAVRLIGCDVTDFLVIDLCAALGASEHAAQLRLVDVSWNPLVTTRGGNALLRLVRKLAPLAGLQAVRAAHTSVPRRVVKQIDEALDAIDSGGAAPDPL